MSSNQTTSLSIVLNAFGYSEKDCVVTPLGNGLINTTYLVNTGKKSVVLQQLNNQVFKQPEHVFDNADDINQHLNIKQTANQYAMQPTQQYKTNDKKNHVLDNGEYWRCMRLIENCYTLEKIENNQQAKLVANAFAQFTSALSDFNSKNLASIIPDFHNLTARLAQLENATSQTESERKKQAQSLIDFIHSQKAFCQEVKEYIKILPLRVTHNDTKINNLLFSYESNKPTAVIDLDTCMAGYLMHDFGDMVRTCCSSLPEDSAEINSMTINFKILSALTEAYINGLAETLTDIERSSLLIGVKLMPFMLSIRFLTDYLNGDQYFKTQYSEHNLMRAKNQMQLYKLFCQNHEKLTEIILRKPVLNAIA